jgi:hypothetical protein
MRILRVEDAGILGENNLDPKKKQNKTKGIRDELTNLERCVPSCQNWVRSTPNSNRSKFEKALDFLTHKIM